MKNNQNIIAELMEVAPAIAGARQQAYTVPQQYFENFAARLLQQIAEGKEPAYLFTTTLPYQVPADYFQKFEKVLLKNLQNPGVFAETESIAPLLNAISKQPVYSIPNQYFSDAHTGHFIPKVTAGHTETPVVPLKRKAVWQYAVAAAVATVIGVAAFLFTDRGANSSNQVVNTSVQIEGLKDDDIINYLKAMTPVNEANAVSTVKIEGELDKTLSSMSDKEIKEFLKENGEWDEI